MAACAPVGPDYRPPAPVLPPAWIDSAATASPSSHAVKLAHWWTLFNDPLLDSLIERAVAASPDLKIAAARLQQARARYRLTTATAAPSVDAVGSYSNTRKSETAGGSNAGSRQDLFLAGFDAGWELDFFGGLRRATEAAQARLAAAAEERRDVLVSLSAEVARNYIELRGSQARLAVARETCAGREKALALARGRFASGLGNRLEVAQAESDLAQARALLPPLANDVGQAGYRLALLLGLPPAALAPELSTAVPLPARPAGLPATLPSELLRRRPDIRRAERELAAATAEIGVATADLFPSFSLTALGGLQSIDLSDLMERASRYWTVGPTVRWSLFNGGRTRAGIELSEAQRDEARSLYEKTVLTALNEVEGAILAFRREEESQKTLAAAVDGDKQEAAVAGGRYRAGLAPLRDVLEAEHGLYQSQDQLIASQTRLSVDLVALCKALGGGWQPAATVAPEVAATTGPTPSGDPKQ